VVAIALRGVAAGRREGVYHAQKRRLGTEGWLPHSGRSFEPAAVRQPDSPEALKGPR
jgi:hypothetical protein